MPKPPDKYGLEAARGMIRLGALLTELGKELREKPMTFKPSHIKDNLKVKSVEDKACVVHTESNGYFVLWASTPLGYETSTGTKNRYEMAKYLNAYKFTLHEEVFKAEDIKDGLLVRNEEGEEERVTASHDRGDFYVKEALDGCVSGIGASDYMAEWLNENNYIRHKEEAPAMPLITMDKKYKTRSGRDVTIYKTDVDSITYSVHGAYRDSYGCEHVESWTAEGSVNQHMSERDLDLIECKPVHTVTRWFCLYSDGTHNPDKLIKMLDREIDIEGAIHPYKKIAIFSHTFEIVEGEGL